MNKNALNTVALNTSAVTGMVVYIDPCVTGISFVTHERAGPYMKGSTGITFSHNGDISKVVNLLPASANITFTTSGNIASLVNMGNVTSGIGFTLSGLLQKVNILPSGSTDIQFSITGDLILSSSLSGSTNISFDISAPGLFAIREISQGFTGVSFTNTGSIIKTSILPSGLTGLDFTTEGVLTKYSFINMGSVVTGINFSTEGVLNKGMYLSGNTSITFTTSGIMANNPAAQDSPARTVYREPPTISRTVYR